MSADDLASDDPRVALKALQRKLAAESPWTSALISPHESPREPSPERFPLWFAGRRFQRVNALLFTHRG
jgi:hypothetical protein